MESGDNQATAGTNWDEWSRVVEAAQDPQHRDAVQQFLAQAELSAEVPAALDEKVLAPRRSEGATGEQCAYILCNLGFASLAAGSRRSAEFAIACERLVEQLGPDTPDLALRRLFLSTKGELLIAVITGQPHLSWDKVGERSTAYLRTLDHNLDALPAESIEQNAMAAFSFAAQLLSRIDRMHVVGHYADQISQLVDAALGLASHLLPAFVSRMWSNLLPGQDAGVMFRRIGAEAERSLQHDEQSVEHATTGLRYIDEIFAQAVKQSAAEREQILQTRAELLLASGRYTEALQQAEALRESSDPSIRTQAVVLQARCKLNTGHPRAAAACLAQVAPTTNQAVEYWRTTWTDESADGDWIDQEDASSAPNNRQHIWRLQAVAAADSQDMPAFMESANRCTGFLVDSPLLKRQELVDPVTALDDIFARLADGATLLQVIKTDAGILTWIAQKQNGEVSQYVAPQRPNARRLIDMHKSWSRAYLEAPQNESEISIAFAALMEEMRRNWGDLFQALVEDGIAQLILIGDDLVDIPLHATCLGTGDERLIDRVPVTYAPSLSLLRASIDRTPEYGSQRKGVAFRSLIDTGLDSDGTAADDLAAILETASQELSPRVSDSLWSELAAARVVHMVARMRHDGRMPLESLLGAGWLDLSIGKLVAELDLAQCDVVSNLHCESALPSVLRAPGFDLAAVFLAAGAGAVLASTWLTQDSLACELTRSFFQNWARGAAPSTAFRDALLDLRLQRPEMADFQWAGMRLVGAP